jgi:hypothetical protein
MIKQDFFMGIGVCAFFVILAMSKYAPQTDQTTGAKWCASRSQLLDKATIGETSRPAYHPGVFTPQLKLTVICKKKGLH